jgi:ABC-type multidrug transport system fused ATPase/permease subunit
LLFRRFYDIKDGGEILIDGHKIDQLNVNWLRSIIGVVSQEPGRQQLLNLISYLVLFAATVAENIRLGNPELTDEEMERIAKIANAHEFVSKFKDRYNTMIGDGGIQLSGQCHSNT